MRLTDQTKTLEGPMLPRVRTATRAMVDIARDAANELFPDSASEASAVTLTIVGEAFALAIADIVKVLPPGPGQEFAIRVALSNAVGQLQRSVPRFVTLLRLEAEQAAK